MRVLCSVATVAVCVVAVFWRLDDVPLWRDEATTAVWGRLMAETASALPSAFDARDGQLLVQDDDGHDINSQLQPAMQSYLQIYLSAAGHRLLGEGTLPARIPFALLGLGSLALLFVLGRQLRGPPWLPYALPLSAAGSIYFLHAARQGRYYVVLVFATVLLFVQVARYFRNPALGVRWLFHVQLCLIGCLLYAANYLSFAATWLALGLFLLLTDRPALVRLCAASTVLAVVLGLEFWLLHAEYLTQWKPGSEHSAWENLRYVVARRGADYWRWVPFVVLAPAGVLAAWSARLWSSPVKSVLIASSAAVPWVGLVWSDSTVRRMPDAAFVAFCLVCLCVPGIALYLWTRIPSPGVGARMALLAGLVLTVCPLFTMAVAGRATLPRYYYQTCPAAIVLTGLVAAALADRGRARVGVACLVGASLWPNLDMAGGGTEQVVWRQLLRYDVHNRPLLDYLSASTRPGDTIAFFRNVKGMVVNYYLPDRRWVNLLDADIPYNRRFRGKVPDDQFDDSPAPDWFVLWDTRDRVPRAFDDRYESVWTRSYAELRSVWRLGTEPRVRTIEVYRRR